MIVFYPKLTSNEFNLFLHGANIYWASVICQALWEVLKLLKKKKATKKIPMSISGVGENIY